MPHLLPSKEGWEAAQEVFLCFCFGDSMYCLAERAFVWENVAPCGHDEQNQLSRVLEICRKEGKKIKPKSEKLSFSYSLSGKQMTIHPVYVRAIWGVLLKGSEWFRNYMNTPCTDLLCECCRPGCAPSPSLPFVCRSLCRPYRGLACS